MNTNSPAMDPVDLPGVTRAPEQLLTCGERSLLVSARYVRDEGRLRHTVLSVRDTAARQRQERSAADLEPLAGLERAGLRPPASWYRQVQAARIRLSGKPRSVEFSGLSVQRLDWLFPGAQFLVVHQLKRAVDRSRRLPALGSGRILQISSEVPATATTLARVMTFLSEPTEPVVVDLSDHDAGPDLVLPSEEDHMFIEER